MLCVVDIWSGQANILLFSHIVAMLCVVDIYHGLVYKDLEDILENRHLDVHILHFN
jgi:hypothetical protein